MTHMYNNIYIIFVVWKNYVEWMSKLREIIMILKINEKVNTAITKNNYLPGSHSSIIIPNLI